MRCSRCTTARGKPRSEPMHPKSEWIRVSVKSPCPVCGKPDYCTRSADGAVVHCMRAESDRSAKGDSGGWIHRMTEPLPPEKPVEKKRLTIAEVTALAKGMYEHKHAADRRTKLAGLLGVSVTALDRLRCGYGCDPGGREFWSFPSRNARREIVGVTRRYEDGEKKTYPGTSNGLFYALQSSQSPGPVFVPEGASDVAAFLSAGLCAIGRPSNVGGVDMLRALLGRLKGRTVVVVGERDERPDKRGDLPTCPVECTGCAHCWPGLHGARQVSAALGVAFVLPPAIHKDFREYWRSGGVWVEYLKLKREAS